MVNVSWCARWRQSDIKDTRREWSLTGSLTEQSVTSSCCKLLPAAAHHQLRENSNITYRGRKDTLLESSYSPYYIY